MNDQSTSRDPQRVVVVMPTWVGDTAMATPTLRALRKRYADAHIAALARPMVAPLLEPCPWIDELTVYDPRAEGVTATATKLREKQYDLAVVLPNSFRSALMPWLAGVPHRIGYARGGRGLLLTDRLRAKRDAKGFVPTPTLDYYLQIAERLGSHVSNRAMELFTTPEDDAAADQLLGDAKQPLVLLNVGANYGDAKMWLPERFAAVGDRCVRELGATVAVSGAPKERPIVDAVLNAAQEKVIDLSAKGMDLSALKAVVKRADLMVTNDTGPRHIAAAFGVGIVTIFGPTDPIWAALSDVREKQVNADVFCSPCQLKKCPLDHRCMTRVSVDDVFAQVSELLEAAR